MSRNKSDGIKRRNLKHQEHKKNDSGFSLLELLVAIVVMMIVLAAVFALMRSSMISSTATLEMSDGQESARAAQEYINRDLMNVGDGLNGVNPIRVPQNFVQSYLSLNPIPDPALGADVNLGLLTSDNDVPANTVVPGTLPAGTVRTATDRITILQADQSFTAITLAANAIDLNTGIVAVAPTDIDKFRNTEIYFITSGRGGIFVTITDRQNVTGPNPSLVFAAGDPFGLNSVGANSQLDWITDSGNLPTSLCRMKLIHYYTNANGLLMRRVFGVRSAGFLESPIAEHVVGLNFRYFLNLRDGSGNMVQPEAQLTTSEQQRETRQVEVSITAETPHLLQNGQRQQMTMTTSTSVRNMQFRRTLQPGNGS